MKKLCHFIIFYSHCNNSYKNQISLTLLLRILKDSRKQFCSHAWGRQRYFSLPSNLKVKTFNIYMKQNLIFGSLLTAGIVFSAAAVNPGVKVEHLGPNNTFVRVNTDSLRYLMLPVQESLEDIPVAMIVDGQPAGTFYIRLSTSKKDYEVPFDLTPYKGKNLILDFSMRHDRSSKRNPENEICWESMFLTDTLNLENTEKYRPLFHHTPLYGWMNDPNGMFYKDGKWHLYYQWNPYGSKWQNMTWGHSASDDLITWDALPTAISPNALGAIFSGSAAVDHKNTAGFGEDAVVAMYTSAGHSQMQSIASSTDDGTTFDVYAGNPVITLESEARDPKIFFNEETGLWNMTLAHALDHEMLFFSSPDLKTWTLNSAFGKEGAVGGVWECPDLFELEIDGKNKWVLLCNLNPGGPFGGSATQYFVGEFDGNTFVADTDENGKIITKWMDFGKDHYATVTWSDAPDNRRVALGWMSNWQYAPEVPTMQFRSANTLPRDLSLFSAPDGQIYLASSPSPELARLKGKAVASSKTLSVSEKGKKFNLPKSNDGVCEITATLKARAGSNISLSFSNEKEEKVDLIYNANDHTISFDRTQSGITDFSHDFPAVTVAPTFESDGVVTLDIFIDRSSMEVFVNGGKSVMTNLVFPTSPYTTLKISGTGKATVENLNIYELNL